MNQPAATAPNPCQKAAQRVRTLFSRSGSIEPKRKEDNLETRSCTQVKLPRVPASLKQLFLAGYQIAAQMKKKEPSSMHINVSSPSSCCINDKHPSFMQMLYSGGELCGDRVKRVKLKEHLLAARKLKDIKKRAVEIHQHHEFTLLDAPPPKKEDNSNKQNMQIWKENLQKKEERPFKSTSSSSI